MQKNARNNEGYLISRRYPMLAWVAFFLCFVLFPLFLIDSLIDRMQAAESERLRSVVESHLEDALDYIESYSRDDRFVHKLLGQSFNRINAADDPLQKFAQEKKKINRAYPGSFFFVVWDKNGKTIGNLSDEDSYAYILKETFQFFQELSGLSSRTLIGGLSGEKDFSRRLKLIGNYIGRMVRLDKIVLPLLEESAASSILSEPYGPKFHMWYGIGNKLSIMCFIDRKFFDSFSSINFALKRLQKRRPQLDAGVSFFPVSEENLVRFGAKTAAADAVMALAKFENLHPGQFLFHNDRYYAYRFVDFHLRAFCSISAEYLHPNWSKAWFFATIAKFVFILAFVLYVFLLGLEKFSFSVSMKLAGLFVYAGGLPILIAMMIGIDYFSQKESQLTYACHNDSLEQLRIIDEGFDRFINRQNLKFKEVLQSFVLKKGLSDDIDFLEKLATALEKELNPDSIVVFDRQGKNRAPAKFNRLFSDLIIIGQLCSDVLSFWNAPDTSNLIVSEIARPLAVTMPYNLGQIKPLSIGEYSVYACYQALSGQNNVDSESMIFVLWRPEELQAMYLQEVMADREGLVAFFPKQMKMLGALESESLVSQILYKASRLSVIRSTISGKNGQNYMLSAMKGAKLDMATLAMLVPNNRITQDLQATGRLLSGYALVFILVAVGSVFLIRQRLIMPLHDFKQVIEGIGQRNFRNQSEFRGKNEFGAMAAALNKTLENLHELEIARIVQENLIPGKSFRLHGVEALARTEQMLQIGGDYYDFFKISDTHCGFFAGDVSGHGISSALYMAMARAAIIMQGIDNFVLESAMDNLNQVFYQSRITGNKEYMTGVMLFLDSLSGNFQLINCGHCPPVIYRAASKSCELIKCGGLPFGFKARVTSPVVSGILHAGDCIILYTDGWVEAESNSGAVHGFSGFVDMIEKNSDADLESFVGGLFQDLHLWQPVQKDDLTVLLIRLCEKKS